jgi:hypothetical protein
VQSHLAEMAIQPAVDSYQGQNHPQPNGFVSKNKFAYLIRIEKRNNFVEEIFSIQAFFLWENSI